MRRHENRHALLIHQAAQHILQRAGALGVQSHRRLVQEQDARLGQESPAQGNFATHAVGVRLNQLGGVIFQVKQLQQGFDAAVAPLGLQVVESRYEVKKFQARELLEQVQLLRHQGELPFRPLGLCPDVVTVDENASGVRTQQAGHHFDGGRLARPVRAKKHEKLAVHFQIQIVDSEQIPVALNQALCLNHSIPQSIFNTARNASCGISTRPNCFMRFLPSFCFSSSFRLRVMSPP